MCCNACKYAICEVCWERRRASLQDTPARPCAVFSVPDLNCPAGHLMERLVGQVVHGDRSCRNCGRDALGSTAPYFMCCRPCRFELCPDCATKRELCRPA